MSSEQTTRVRGVWQGIIGRGLGGEYMYADGEHSERIDIHCVIWFDTSQCARVSSISC